MCQFQALIKKCGANDPIPSFIYTLDHGKMTTIPAATTDSATNKWNVIETDVTLDVALTAGNKWQKLEIRTRSANFTIEQQGEKDAGQHNREFLECFYPESDPEAMYKMGLTKGWTGYVAFTNGNGHTFLWGTLVNEVELLSANFDAAAGGFTIQFERMASAAEGNPPHYTGAIAE